MKKISLVVCSFMVLIAAAGILPGCDKENEKFDLLDLLLFLGRGEGYTVTFDSMGGTDIDDQKIAEGGLVTKPNDPTRDGFKFEAWFTEEACNTEWDFSTDTVTADMILYAKWKEWRDNDGDGYIGNEYGGDDCDDRNPEINPGATEICGNGFDDDCDEDIDEGCPMP